MYYVFHMLAKIKDYQKKKRVTAPILKPTYDQKQETFFFFGGGSYGRFIHVFLVIQIFLF